MGNSSSSPKVSAQDKAILDLKLQRDKLHQYQKRLSHESHRYHTLALSALRSQNRPAALLALRRRKYQETLLSRTDAQLAQLELLTSDVEFALIQKDIYFGLKQGTEVLKEIRREMGGLEGVERLVGRSEEEREFQREVAGMLEGRMSRQEEEDVEDELAALEREETRLPDAPVRKPEGMAQRVEEGGMSNTPEQVGEEPARQLVPA